MNSLQSRARGAGDGKYENFSMPMLSMYHYGARRLSEGLLRKLVGDGGERSFKLGEVRGKEVRDGGNA